MLLCIPISESDKHLLDGFIACLKKFGPYENHQLLVVGSPNVSSEIQATELELRDLFAKSSTLVFKKNYSNGWPHACNFYFYNCAYHIEFELKPDRTLPWYYFELDNTPTKSGWLDELQKDYIQFRLDDGTKVFMGVRQQTLVVDQSTNALKQGTGSHMVGTGIYPVNLSNHSQLIKFVPNVPATPWDVYMQWEIDNPRHSKLSHTDKIQHNWGTANYRKDGDKVVSDSLKDLPLGIKFNSNVRPDAIVVHGCKDGSFANIILGIDPKEIKLADVIPEVVLQKQPDISNKESEQPQEPSQVTENQVEVPTEEKSEQVSDEIQQQDSAEVERLSHKQKVEGSIPSPAIKRRRRGRRRKDLV